MRHNRGKRSGPERRGLTAGFVANIARHFRPGPSTRSVPQIFCTANSPNLTSPRRLPRKRQSMAEQNFRPPILADEPFSG